jgi:hypothetical protein
LLEAIDVPKPEVLEGRPKSGAVLPKPPEPPGADQKVDVDVVKPEEPNCTVGDDPKPVFCAGLGPKPLGCAGADPKPLVCACVEPNGVAVAPKLLPDTVVEKPNEGAGAAEPKPPVELGGVEPKPPEVGGLLLPKPKAGADDPNGDGAGVPLPNGGGLFVG